MIDIMLEGFLRLRFEGLTAGIFCYTPCDYLNVDELIRLPVPSSQYSSVGNEVKGKKMQRANVMVHRCS